MGGWGDPTDPSALLSDSPGAVDEDQRIVDMELDEQAAMDVSLEGRCVFCEFFAGLGSLTSAFQSGSPMTYRRGALTSDIRLR